MKAYIKDPDDRSEVRRKELQAHLDWVCAKNKDKPIQKAPPGFAFQANVLFHCSESRPGMPIIYRLDGKKAVALPEELIDMLRGISDWKVEEENENL